jgi:hypothetical protein
MSGTLFSFIVTEAQVEGWSEEAREALVESLSAAWDNTIRQVCEEYDLDLVDEEE